MKIAVCMKQVPAYSEGNMDEKTGLIIRSGLSSIVNTYDLSALETALQIKDRCSAEVTVFTMGPESAGYVLKEAFAMGADTGYLICDKAFAGADVLATSYTLKQAIDSTRDYDLILCGKQTTDGDTAQVSGALAKWFEIPHLNWVSELLKITEEELDIKYLMGENIVTARVKYPCLLSVERSIFTPRMPTLKLKMQSKNKPINKITLLDLADQDEKKYGLAGSATRVQKIYPPARTKKQEFIYLSGSSAAEYINEILEKLEVSKGESL